VNRGRLLLLALLFSGWTMRGAPAQPAVPAVAGTAASDLFPEVTCTSTDAGVNADILQLADDTRDQLTPLLQLGGAWRFPVHIIVVMPDDPLAARIHEERVAVTAADKTMEIDAAVPSTDPDLKSFVQRQFVTALLWEKFFVNTATFDQHTRLDVVPLWVVEGLNEWLSPDASRDRESIVRRAALARQAPKLAEVTSWQQISDDRLLGLYQRAFCYYLVDSLIRPGPKRDDFQEWLTTIAGPRHTSANLLLPTEEGWQRELREAPARSHDIIYTWDETAAAFSAADTIAVPSKEKKTPRTCTFDSVTGVTASPELTAALQAKIFDLTALELRAHPSWRPILELYRFGLTALANQHPDRAQVLIAQARQRRSRETEYHQKLIDYVNWFEVAKNYAGSDSQFESYFSTARQMNQVEADPDHPNPIRADLLRVESRL
jgi:hypothetical protein